MQELIGAYLSQVHNVFYMNQVLVIVCLFLFGLLCVFSVTGRMNYKEYMMAFPVGLSLYVLASFVILTAGIPFKKSIVVATLLIAAAVFVGLSVKKKIINPGSIDIKTFCIVLSAVVIVAVIACSGLISVSLSNDSLYYYNLYSKAMVKYGEYRRVFNVFLTDVGQGAAIIGTLPHMFGFNETFGIQTFFNINFLVVFLFAATTELEKYTQIKNKRQIMLVSLIALASLTFAMPFIIVSKWAMANVYFMEYFFICAYYARICSDDAQKKERIVILSILITTLSLLRMEGTIMVIFLLLCISMLELSNKEIACVLLLPTAILQIGYCVRIFMLMNIDAPYTFLTKEKAVIQLVALIGSFIYFLVLRNRIFKKIFSEKAFKYVILLGLIFVNVVLLFIDHSLYIMNIKAFAKNLLHQSGWGSFPVFVFGLCVLIAFMYVVDHAVPEIEYYDVLWIGFVLTTLAVSWARDDALQENVGDSGNRVLLQIVPLVVIALTIQIGKAIGRKNNNLKEVTEPDNKEVNV